MYSHTENIITVTQRDATGRPTHQAIVGTRDMTASGHVIAERLYKQPIDCLRDGTRKA